MKTRLTVLLIGLIVAGVWLFPTFEAVAQSGTTLSANLDCAPHKTITYNWTIDKSVVPESWDLFNGDAGTSQFTINVTKDAGTYAEWIDGQICVTNGGAVATENLTIVINLRDGVPPPNDLVAVYPLDISDHPVLAPGETYCYSYHVDIPASDFYHTGDWKVNPAVTITNHSGHLGSPYGPSPSCTSVFPSAPTLINNTINVDDSNGGTFAFDASGSTSYTVTFTCDSDEGTHNNVATILETGQTADASVTVNCYALEIQKDAHTSFTRTYNWTIDKAADQSALTLATGQTFTGVNYTVEVDATYIDSDWAVGGTITVYNPAPIPATINSITDVVSGVGTVTSDCAVSFPYTLAAGETLSCTYSAGLPDASSRTNTATATLQNYSYDYLMAATANGTSDFSGSAAVDFAGATMNHVDECADVTDSYAGSLGTLCYGGGVPKTFKYMRDIGPYSTCGDYVVENFASFETNDTHTAGSDSWNISVTIPCGGGCTLTLGYWKTHSEFGPAPYDDTWALLPSGASTVFFLSGVTWYQVFWTTPSGRYNLPVGHSDNIVITKPVPTATTINDSYYILAHQYMAAKLNWLNGASTTPEVDAAILWAETQYFNILLPTSSINKALRQTALDKAALLDQYNSGLIGPGHCSEVGPAKLETEILGNEDAGLIPDAYDLAQNYPNPFNPVTDVSFTLPAAMDARLDIFNALGQKVATLVDQPMEAGVHTFTWDASQFASGVYFYRLTAGEFVAAKKMILLK